VRHANPFKFEAPARTGRRFSRDKLMVTPAPFFLEGEMGEEIKLAVELAGFLVTLGVMVWRLSSATTKFELIGAQQASEISQIKRAIEKIDAVITAVAVQNTRLDNMDERFGRLERQLDEYKRGEGLTVSPPPPRPSSSS
jgi:hypothetical protein